MSAREIHAPHMAESLEDLVYISFFHFFDCAGSPLLCKRAALQWCAWPSPCGGFSLQSMGCRARGPKDLRLVGSAVQLQAPDCRLGGCGARV